MNPTKEDIIEECSTNAASSANSAVSLTSIDSEEELMSAMSQLIMDQCLYNRVADWLQERGIERGDPTTIFDSYTLKKRQSVVLSLRTPQADSNLNNSEQPQEKKSSLKMRRPPTLKVSTVQS